MCYVVLRKPGYFATICGMRIHPLRRYRDQNDLSQADLAEKLGISRQLVGLIENGEREVTPENARDWEKIIGIAKQQFRPDIYGEPHSERA